VRNPFRRQWRVQKFRPSSGVDLHQPIWGIWSTGTPVEELPPAPKLRLFWTLRRAIRERDRLNRGMELIHGRERFRVVRNR